MNVSDQPAHRRPLDDRAAVGEIALAVLVFASMGAMTWAIRGTSGWGGIDGTIVPGMTWGVLWWYVCWRKGVDARGIALWLGLGIALGGELGYGQYVSWIRGIFNVGEETIAIAPWIGYAWFAMCGVGWGAPGAIALGWALGGRKPLGVWLARLVIPVGAAILARLAVQTWPGLFFPHWHLGVYVAEAVGAIDPAAAATAQRYMIVVWLASAALSAGAWLAVMRVDRPGWTVRAISLCTVGAAIALLLPVAEWLFFPNDQLGLFAGHLGRHLGRTVYTNAQNAIVVGWWIGAFAVAAVQRDRCTLLAGSVIAIGFGVGFPLAAVWCLGYTYAPHLVDWWKVWELQSGSHLGLLYVVVLYWAIRHVDTNREGRGNDDRSTYARWCETAALAGGAFAIIYVMAQGALWAVGLPLGLLYVVALALASVSSEGATDRRRGISFVYSVLLLVFILVWGASSQAGVLLGLYDAAAVDQYAWPSARIAIFAPAGTIVVGAALVAMWRVLRNRHLGLPPRTEASRIDVSRTSARIVDLMTFTGAVGAVSIWPAKIGVVYAILLAAALFGFNRLNRRLDRLDCR